MLRWRPHKSNLSAPSCRLGPSASPSLVYLFNKPLSSGTPGDVRGLRF